MTRFACAPVITVRFGRRQELPGPRVGGALVRNPQRPAPALVGFGRTLDGFDLLEILDDSGERPGITGRGGPLVVISGEPRTHIMAFIEDEPPSGFPRGYKIWRSPSSGCGVVR